jgi:hypothetical protein
VKAVVVYESMHWDTHQVADPVGRGLASRGEVVVVPVAEAMPALVTGADHAGALQSLPVGAGPAGPYASVWASGGTGWGRPIR